MPTVEMSTQEQEQAVQKAVELAEHFARLGPPADKENTFAYDSAPLFKESGLGGLQVPKEYGGMGGDIWTTCRVISTLAKGDPGIALSYCMHYIMVGIMMGLLTDEQKKEWLPRFADGDILCGTFSETRGFGGLADTRAVPQKGGGWKLYGQKTWATLSEVSDIWSGSATITDADGKLPEDFEERVARESNFIVGLDAPGTGPGLKIKKTWDAMGMRATGTHTLVFDGFFVPEDGYCGEMRGGIFANLEWASLGFASVYWGVARRVYEETRAILREKHSGPIFSADVGADIKSRDIGYIIDGIGEIMYRNETTARVIQATCRQIIEGADDEWDPSYRPALIGVAKVFSTENCIEVAHKAMRLVGGMSYRRGHPLEKLYRDAAAGPYQPLTADQTYMYFGRLELGSDEA
ncbi:MAG: acyl-CoA dehydrogenase family protein [Acidimicrobiia bacterium]